jgi:hypothetical protein
MPAEIRQYFQDGRGSRAIRRSDCGRTTGAARPFSRNAYRRHHQNDRRVDELQNAELMKLLLPVLRADFSLSETFKPAVHAARKSALILLDGIKDREVTEHERKEWGNYFSKKGSADV